jgi:predicted neutral ceramidase superfamily lipid hydrolase
MRKDYEKLFNYIESQEPPKGLFDKIILAIKKEQELRHGKRLLFGFLLLLIISALSTPFSFMLLISQIKSSGIHYFISSALSNFNVFISFWKEFSLAILESIPIVAVMIFILDMALVIFTLRLFLYKKRLLLNYLIKN